MFTLSSVSRRGQSSALIDEAHDEPVTNMFDDRRQSRRGRDRTSSSRGRDRTSSTFSNSNGGGGGEGTVPPSSSRGGDRRNPSNNADIGSSNSSRRRALEALMTTTSSSGTHRNSTTTTMLTHNDNNPTILSPEDVHSHLPAQVRSFQQLARPVSRGGKLTSTTGSSDALFATTTTAQQRAGQPQQTRVMSGQPSPRFVFSGDTGLTAFTLVGAPPPPPHSAGETAQSSTRATGQPPLPYNTSEEHLSHEGDLAYSTTTPIPATASSSSAMVTPHSARGPYDHHLPNRYHLPPPPPSAHSSQQTQLQHAQQQRRDLGSATIASGDSERPLTERKRNKSSAGAGGRTNGVGSTTTTATMEFMASLFGHQKPLDWNLFGLTGPTTAVASTASVTVGAASKKPTVDTGAQLHSPLLLQDGSDATFASKKDTHNGISPTSLSLPPRPVARQKEPSQNMDLFADSGSLMNGFERSPVELDALVIVRSKGSSSRRKNSEGGLSKESSSCVGLPPPRPMKTSSLISRLDSGGTPLSPAIADTTSGGGMYAVVSPLNNNNNNTSKENTMASSGHRSSSSASTRSSDGGSPSHFDMTPVSPPKTKGNGSGGHATTTKSTKQRQGSTRGNNAPPPPRLEDVVLFPATTIGVAGTNLLMSSSTVTAPPVAAAAGGGSRRKTSAAQQQPFDDLLPTSHNNSSGNPPGSHHPSKVDDDFGSDPFPMQKQKKKKIPIIIDEEWDDVWAFPNEHLQQQQQQQRVVMEQHAGEHVQMSNSGVRAGQHEDQQQHGSDLSGLPKPKPRSAWSSSLLSPQNVVPPQGGNSPHAVSPSHKDEQTKSSTSTAQHATTTTTTIGQWKPSGMSLTRLGSTHGKPTSLLPMNPNSNHAVADDGMKDGVSSPMLPHGPHPPPTPTNIRAASEGTRAPRAPSTELVANSSSTRRSKEGSFRRSFPGAGFGGLGPVGSDALAPNSRSSFASPTEVDDVDRVLSSALSPMSVTSGGGGDQGMTDGSMSACPQLHSSGAPPPPPPPSAVSGSRQQAFARKQHAM